ncbi:MAG: hypothetical protein ACI8PZ_003599 [Myxococcota bacterium]
MRPIIWNLIGCAWLATAPANAAPVDDDAVPSAWLLADQDAREAGITLEVSGQAVDAALPVELERDLELSVTDGERGGSAWVEAGLLYWVQGRHGKVRATRPGVNVDPDAVALRTDAHSARTLAEDLDASLELDGDQWVLRGEGVLFDLSYAALPQEEVDVVLLPMARTTRRGVTVVPKKVATARTRVRSPKRAQRWIARQPFAPSPVAGANSVSRDSLTAPDHPTLSPDRSGETPADLVAWYCDAAKCLVLGVDGLAHHCAKSGCAEAGAWSAGEGWVDVGAERYVWSDGTLVRATDLANSQPTSAAVQEVQP